MDDRIVRYSLLSVEVSELAPWAASEALEPAERTQTTLSDE